MSMKRCFDLSVSTSASMFGRAILVGSILSFATACAHRDAGKTDSTIASADSATTAATTTTTATPASPVESVSTGETAVSAESKSSPAVAATNVTTGAPKAVAKPATAHHVVHHTDSTNVAAAAPAPADAPAAATASAATADTGEKATAATAGAVDHLLVSPQEYEGWKMFSVYCYRCHGVDAMGGGIAPNLRHSVSSEGSVTHDVFITTVTDGRLAKGMPTWKALLSREQMEDLWLYINARSSNRLYPGRPHMAQGANP